MEIALKVNSIVSLNLSAHIELGGAVAVAVVNSIADRILIVCLKYIRVLVLSDVSYYAIRNYDYMCIRLIQMMTRLGKRKLYGQ